MADLPERSNFDEGVRQLELTDPVVGGPNGVSNAPLRNLANRTRWLKDKLDELLPKKADLDGPALSGKPTAPTPEAADNSTQIATTEWVRSTLSKLAAPLEHVRSRGDAHGVATATEAGFMSPQDKKKLDGIHSGAEPNKVKSVATKTGDVVLEVADVKGAAPTANPSFTGTMRVTGSGSSNSIYADSWIRTAKNFNSDANVTTLTPDDTYVPNFRWLKIGAVLSINGKRGNIERLEVGDVTGAAPTASPSFSGTISVAENTITDLNAKGAKVYVPAKKVGDMTAPEPVSKFALQDYAAPKASPTFTGAPTAPTPVSTDNSTRLATTAWVRAAMSSIASAAGFSVYEGGSTGAFTIKLPSWLGGIVIRGTWLSTTSVEAQLVTWGGVFSRKVYGAWACPSLGTAYTCAISIHDHQSFYVEVPVSRNGAVAKVWVLGIGV